MGEIIPSESLSHVTYTGINSMRYEGLKLKNRTRNKKSAVKDRPMKDPPQELKKLALIIAEINRNTKGRKA